MPICPRPSQFAALAGFVLTACNEATTAARGTPTDAARTLSAGTRPFEPKSDNPYFRLVPGTTFHYQSRTKEGLETEDFIVTTDTKVISGVKPPVTALVVEDIVRLNGTIIEHTFDWFAQDKEPVCPDCAHDIWYFGEDSREFDPITGEFIGTEGSWEAGRNGAEPGIIMEGDPQVGDTYREEFAQGVAEDMARVLSLDARARVPYGSFSGCLKTENFTPLEPDVREEKYYCAGVGLVLEVSVTGGKERNELVSITPP